MSQHVPCPGPEEEEGTALVPRAPAHPGAGKWLGVPTLGILEDEDSPLPLLQGPEPFMWPNQSGQELGAAEPQLPASFPSPHGGKLGPSGLSLHRGGTAPILPSAPAQGSLTARDGAVGMGVQPSLPFLIPSSLPCSHFPRSLGYLPCPHCLPRARLAHEHCASAKPRMPQEETSLLPLPVLPPPLRQAVPECERKLLRR